MAKGKSSASSATRKKHARKAEKSADLPLPKEKKPKGKDKGKSKEPRKKVYVPPVKPTPVQEDPLDSLGLVHQLPPGLSVVLRRLNKKDAVTKTKALDELQSGWIDPINVKGVGEDGDTLIGILALMLPAWVRLRLFTLVLARIQCFVLCSSLDSFEVTPCSCTFSASLTARHPSRCHDSWQAASNTAPP